jgi:hypothetical protein
MPLEIEIDRRLSKDRKRARITFPAATLDVEVGGINTIIAALGAMRSAMLPEEPTAFVPPKSVHAIPNPGWTVEPELLNGDVLVHLRDPRFGWLHYCLPKGAAERLGTHLLNLARANITAHRPN